MVHLCRSTKNLLSKSRKVFTSEWPTYNRMISSVKVFPKSLWIKGPSLGLYGLTGAQYHGNVYGSNIDPWPPGRGPYKGVPTIAIKNRAANSNLYRLVTAFRQHGHKQAHLDPLSNQKAEYWAELDPASYGLSENDNTVYDLDGILNSGPQRATVQDLVLALKGTYCGPLTAEFQHLMEEEEREWFAEKYELVSNGVISKEEKRALGMEMLRSQVFDNFLAAKFGTIKRYSGEGAESMMAFFTTLFQAAREDGIEQVVMCMPHRGRLNTLTGMLQYPPANMFRKMRGLSEFPDGEVTTGDVLSHLVSSCDIPIGGKHLHVTMIPNPSHLEAANPVAVGKARAKQMMLKDCGYSNNTDAADRVLCFQVHGDAAFAAQGINMESLAQANVPHFTVGGSVHLIVNNQLGFTTPAHRGRSSMYCSDLAKMIATPIIHVNGDYPEEVAKSATLAMEYRQKFHKDIFVDLVCFRRWGHNEIDDPTFTNPIMYEAIHARQSIPDQYANKLIEEGTLTQEEVTQIVGEHNKFLSDEFNKIESYRPTATSRLGSWKSMSHPTEAVTCWDTGIEADLLRYLGAKSVEVPKDFKMHIQNRLNKVTEGTNLDWATAEAMAIGSLLYQGFNVRLSGQDVGRGTFSHRHGMLVDQKTGGIHIPLNDIIPNQTSFFEIANCILSEEAVLAFEYGMSIEHPNNLIVWEAQFGDFFNGAQIIIDTFITSGETKWLLQSGLVMLLPHGYDGAGPEHSSCRVERFLQLCDSKEEGIDGDDVNFQIAHPTTPAQYFHLLRRQMVRNFRKPLLVVAPKLLLRLPAATSSFVDMAPGTSFRPVLGDVKATGDHVTRVIFCSGKHYYALDKQRESNSRQDTAIIRLEALCPFPTKELQEELAKYPKANGFIWSQEEPQNMGPWSFVAPRFQNLVGCKLKYSGRRPMPTPAVGIGKIHQEEAKHVVETPFKINL